MTGRITLLPLHERPATLVTLTAEPIAQQRQQAWPHLRHFVARIQCEEHNLDFNRLRFARYLLATKRLTEW